MEKITDEKSAQLITDNLIESQGLPDIVYMLAGAINKNDHSLQAVSVLNILLQTNFTGPIFIINEIIRKAGNQRLNVIVASSIAAARPRSKNLAYSTAKLALENYCLGLMHAMAETKIKIQFIRLGYLDTRMTYGMKLPFPAASTEKVAGKMSKLAEKSAGCYYMPRYWFFLIFILRSLPFGIYKKLKF